MPGFFPESRFTTSGLRRRKILRPLRIVVWAAALLAGSSAVCQSQAPPASPKIYHAPITLPVTKFYDTPVPLPAGKPGELIRSEPFNEYHRSYDVSAVHILYHSRSPNGADVAVSGVVLLPNRTPPAAGWPVIAWAHDFTGSARPCAPSLLKNLKDGALLSMYASLGYAVVASDYAGLGTKFPHATLDLRSNALDVIYSIPASGAALPQLGTKWVAAGYAQGGLIAVGLAEAGNDLTDPNYLGAVAVSGVEEPQEFFQRLAQGPDNSLFVFLAQGIKTVFPEFRVEDILTDKAIPLYQDIRHTCEARSGPQPAPNGILKPGWQNNPNVKQFFSRNTLSRNRVHGPLLLISGESDSDMAAALTATLAARFCKQKDQVLFLNFPGLNPSAVLGNSVSEQLSWIRGRFAGVPAPSNCP